MTIRAWIRYVASIMAYAIIALALMTCSEQSPASSARKAAPASGAREITAADTVGDFSTTSASALFTSSDLDDEECCCSLGCGTNSPEIYGSPIEALHSSRGLAPGQEIANRQGIVLLRGSLRPPAGPQCSGAINLIVYEGLLIGTDQDDRLLCGGPDLEGATFSILVPPSPVRFLVPATLNTAQRMMWREERIRIGRTSHVVTWHLGTSYQTTTYRFTRAGNGADSVVAETSLCASAPPMGNDQIVALVSQNLRSALSLTARPPQATYSQVASWMAERDDAILVQGESYDESGAVFHHHNDWFNIACFGSALSKSALLGYNAYTSVENLGGYSDAHLRQVYASYAHERVATLKMITGRYDGRVPRTKPRVSLHWKRVPSSIYAYVGGYHGDPVYSDLIEAHWSAAGATCLSTSRLEFATPVRDPSISPALRAEFNLEPCHDAQGNELPPPPGTIWTTYVGPPNLTATPVGGMSYDVDAPVRRR